MPHKPVAVVAAMRRELAPLLRGIRPKHSDGVEFFELDTSVIAVGGIGREAARRTSEAVVAKYDPGIMISAGIAGAVFYALKVGDVVRSRGAIDAQSGRVFAAGGDARVVTVSSVGGPAEKRAIAQRWKAAEVVDMEAAAVAEVAESRGIWFAAIKAISDESDFEMPPVARFVDSAGQFQTLRFAAFIAIRPKWWAAVRELDSNSRVAASKLSEALKHLIDQESLATKEQKIAGK